MCPFSFSVSSCSVLDQFATESGLGSDGEWIVKMPSEWKPQTHCHLVHEWSAYSELASSLIALRFLMDHVQSHLSLQLFVVFLKSVCIRQVS